MQSNAILRKNANFMLTIPSSEEEKKYYSLHASELKAFGYCLIPLQMVWAFFDWKAISTILEQNLDVWQLILAAKLSSFIVLLLLHWVLNVTTQTAFTKWFSGQRQKGNFTIPAIIGLVMLGFSVFGAINYSNTFSYKANVTEFGETTYDKLKSETQIIYESDCATIRAKYEAKAGRKASAARNEINRLNAKKIISDNDERWVKKLISKQQNIIAAASHQFDFEKNKELQKASDKRNASLENINAERSSTLLSHADKNNKEVEKEASGNATSQRFGWIVSLLFMCLFYFFIYKIQKILHFSGIKKESEMTFVEQHNGHISMTLGVLKDVFNRKYIAFLNAFHKKYTQGTQSVSDFDTNLKVLTNQILQPIENESFGNIYATAAPIAPTGRTVVKGFVSYDNTATETVITPKTLLPLTELSNKTQGERYKELKQRISTRMSQKDKIGKGRKAETITSDIEICLHEIKFLNINQEYEKERKDIVLAAESFVIDLKKEVQND